MHARAHQNSAATLKEQQGGGGHRAASAKQQGFFDFPLTIAVLLLACCRERQGERVQRKESPAFEVLPSLKRLKQRVTASGRGQYDAVFMSGSGSTIVGIGSPDPPQFVYDDEEYQDVFLSEATFITREDNEWYKEPISSDSASEFSRRAE